MSDYIDLGECLLMPVDEMVGDNLIPIEHIFEGIKESIYDFVDEDTTFLNIIACEEMAVHLMSDYIRCLPRHIKTSVSIMKNYNIIPLSGQIDYKAPMVVLHSGLDLNVNEMMLRIFSTMSYRFTKPVYITLFDHEYSPYPILPNIWPKSYSGYGMPAEDRTNDYFTIKYE